MKILAIHSAYNEDQDKRPAVDMWRISRPLEELAKHVDWQIDHRPTLIPSFEQYKDKSEFTAEEMERAFNNITGYDIVFSSYQANPTFYTLLKVAAKRAGVQYIMDVDDDLFAVNPDNPVWCKVNDENMLDMQCMVRDNAWISTTTPALAKRFRDRRPSKADESVFIAPNYISDVYAHPPLNNGEKLVIGFFGGSSHYGDLHNTGALEAIERLMHEHKNLYFKSVGMIIDKYLPRARAEVATAKRGDGWLTDIYPSLNMDISIGPLEDNIFNHGKSDIKWQESTRAGAAFVASNIGPYAALSNRVVHKTNNTSEDWYNALKPLVESQLRRKNLVARAQAALVENHRLETNWQTYKDMFETVYNYKKENNHARLSPSVH